jgi:hypothetical protein
LEHGDNLSQRTFRLRQVTQLRSFGVVTGADMDDCFALFSGAKAEPSAPTLPGAENIACDMLWLKGYASFYANCSAIQYRRSCASFGAYLSVEG